MKKRMGVSGCLAALKLAISVVMMFVSSISMAAPCEPPSNTMLSGILQMTGPSVDPAFQLEVVDTSRPDCANLSKIKANPSCVSRVVNVGYPGVPLSELMTLQRKLQDAAGDLVQLVGGFGSCDGSAANVFTVFDVWIVGTEMESVSRLDGKKAQSTPEVDCTEIYHNTACAATKGCRWINLPSNTYVPHCLPSSSADMFNVPTPAMPTQTFQCSGGAGGPTPAHATVTLSPVEGDNYSVLLQLTNKALPAGVSALLTGKLTSTSPVEYLNAVGKIGDAEVNIIVDKSSGETQADLSVYAVTDGKFDRQIEFGFGAHFSCTLRQNAGALSGIPLAQNQTSAPFSRTIASCAQNEDGGASAQIVYTPSHYVPYNLLLHSCTFNQEVQRYFCSDNEYPVATSDDNNYSGPQVSWTKGSNEVDVAVNGGPNWWNKYLFKFTDCQFQDQHSASSCSYLSEIDCNGDPACKWVTTAYPACYAKN